MGWTFQSPGPHGRHCLLFGCSRLHASGSQCVPCLKPYRSDGRTQPPPPPELVDDCPEWTVEHVLDHKVVKRGRQSKVEYLIHGEGYGDEHNT